MRQVSWYQHRAAEEEEGTKHTIFGVCAFERFIGIELRAVIRNGPRIARAQTQIQRAKALFFVHRTQAVPQTAVQTGRGTHPTANHIQWIHRLFVCVCVCVGLGLGWRSAEQSRAQHITTSAHHNTAQSAGCRCRCRWRARTVIQNMPESMLDASTPACDAFLPPNRSLKKSFVKNATAPCAHTHHITTTTPPPHSIKSSFVSATYHITSHHITSHHITSHHITSHRITSHHITSHHTTSHHEPQLTGGWTHTPTPPTDLRENA